MGLSRELMFKLPLEKRWELYLSKQKARRVSNVSVYNVCVCVCVVHSKCSVNDQRHV